MSAGPFWRRPRVRHLTELTITTAFWFAWVYLILPLLSLLLWLVGYQLFVEEMLVLGGYQALLRELRIYGLVILAMSLVMLVWISWIRHHYGRHNKRTHQPSAVTPDEQAAHAGLTAAELAGLQAARQATVDFDEQDRLRIGR